MTRSRHSPVPTETGSSEEAYMAKEDPANLTGHAKWLAERQAIAKRNDAARANAREARRLRDAGFAARRRAQDEADRASTPKPGPR